MNDLKNFARFFMLATLMFWCVSSAGAVQQVKPKPVLKPMPATADAAQAHPAKHAVGKMGIVRPKPVKKSVSVRHVAAKKPAQQVVKPRATAPSVPAISSAAALAAQSSPLPPISHGRDPFAALVRPSDPNDSHTTLPPGIAGLQVATVRIQGMVKTSDGMVAVVANPQDSVYFLHDGDHIYDGVVEKIGIDDITFRQETKDAFGRTVDRNVSKRLYPIVGDEQ